MLRRIASHLYWVGRHIERAEWRARLVDVNYHLLIEAPPRGAEPWSPLLAITGERDAFLERHATIDEAAVLDFFIFDATNPSSIRSCLLAARDNARELRHRISSELWIELNTLYLEAQQWRSDDLAARGVFEFFSDLRDRFYRLHGVVYGTLPRDLGFEFMDVGRALEGVENVARLLDVKYHYLLPHADDVGQSVDMLQWAAVLRSASALEAYRKLHGNLIGVEGVVGMLLFDPTFPRSARFGAERLARALATIDGVTRGGARGSSSPNAAVKLVEGLAVTSASDTITTGLHEYLIAVQDACTAVGDVVFEQYLSFE